jgi:hypothetical protein
MAKMYRSSQGKGIDLGSLLLQNENVRAVGNMGVNARGDVINNRGKSIDSRVNQKKRQYNKQIGPQDAIPSESKAQMAVADKVVADPVALVVEKPKKTVAKKPKAKKTVAKKQAPVVDESVIDVAPATEATPEPVAKASGLADAIARAKKIKQEAIIPPRQAAQQQQGVKKL